MSKNNDAIICFILFSIIIIAPPTRDLNIWLCGRQTDLSVMRVKVGMANFFFESIDRYWRNKYIANLIGAKLYFSINSSYKNLQFSSFSWDILSRNYRLWLEFRRFYASLFSLRILYSLTLWLIFLIASIVTCRAAIRALRRASVFLAWSMTLRSLKLLAVALLALSCALSNRRSWVGLTCAP